MLIKRLRGRADADQSAVGLRRRHPRHGGRRLAGVGPALTVAMLLPLTVKLEPTGALIMFAGIYYGAMYGGSTTTILLNTPGESASIATALEGNKMAKRGRAGPALATAAIGSFVAGTIATVAADAACAGRGRDRAAIRSR